MGRARGGDKHAVDLEKSANHCEFRLVSGRLALIDLGSPGGTLVNGEAAPFAQELALSENDHLRINGRDLFLTVGRVRPDLTPAKAKVVEARPRRTSPSAPWSPRPRTHPQSAVGVRGAAAQAERDPARLVRGLFRILELFVAGGRRGWARLLGAALELRRFREPILVGAVLAALIAWKLYPHPQAPEAPPQRLTASGEELPRLKFEPNGATLPATPLHASDTRLALTLPPPTPSSPSPLALRATQAGEPAAPRPSPAALPRGELALAHLAAPKPTGSPHLTEHEPEDVPHAKWSIETPPQDAFATIVLPPTPPVAMASSARPRSDSGADGIRITAISVMTSDARRTTFKDYVSADRVVAAYAKMNQGQATASKRFFNPTLSREGATYRLDWCLLWENSCGKPAADEYCREMGYSEASSFDQAAAVGGPDNPTAIIGESGVFCPGNAPGHRCDGFSYIECR